jgi:hypothetical protein
VDYVSRIQRLVLSVAALLWIRGSRAGMDRVALFGTVFWTAAFIPYAFVDPVIQPIVIAAIAVPLHALAWLTADQEVKEEEVGA